MSGCERMMSYVQKEQRKKGRKAAKRKAKKEAEEHQKRIDYAYATIKIFNETAKTAMEGDSTLVCKLCGQFNHHRETQVCGCCDFIVDKHLANLEDRCKKDWHIALTADLSAALIHMTPLATLRIFKMVAEMLLTDSKVADEEPLIKYPLPPFFAL